MIHKHKTVIASLRNKQNVRVFIPEKLRIGGVSYVQPYKFMRVLPSTQPILVSTRAQLVIPISILINEVTLTSPFSIELIKSYLDQLSIKTYMQKYPANNYQILSDSKRGDAWNPQFLAGKASFTAL